MVRTDNEPEAIDCLGNESLVHTPTTGMRVAPEVLVFELFRELGYGDSRSSNPNESRAQDYSDSIQEGRISDSERLLLNTCRGRRKNSRSRREEFFFAPPYLGLAKHAWFRKNSDRTIRDYFLGGPLAHQQKLEYVETEAIVKALLGHRSARSDNDVQNTEILSLLAIEQYSNPTEECVLDYLVQSLEKGRSAPLAREGHTDPFAFRLYADFIEICRLEEHLPRREWLFFLTAYLRTSVTMWLLAHMRITTMVRRWVLDAAEQKELPREIELLEGIRRRHEGLLHPTSSLTREAYQHVEDYMRARIELRILVQQVEEMNPATFHSTSGSLKKLTLSQSSASSVTLDSLLTVVRNSDWHSVICGNTIEQWLIRKAERYAAWRSPRTIGQGKNIDEFLRVLYRTEEDESGSGLLITGTKDTTRIVPGHRLLQLFAYLAARAKSKSHSQETGKLVLQDIEQHLFEYGIDFRASSYGRPLLIQKLAEGGFLVGSPDAGESAQVLDTIGVTLT